MRTLLLIFIGGGIGCICRYAISKVNWIESIPLGTLAANVISSFILGALIGLSLLNMIKHPHQMLLMTGFCGGFSTFSTFSAELVQLYLDGAMWSAMIYLTLSILAGVLSVFAGMMLVRVMYPS